jgi:hypothetical protein
VCHRFLAVPCGVTTMRGSFVEGQSMVRDATKPIWLASHSRRVHILVSPSPCC